MLDLVRSRSGTGHLAVSTAREQGHDQVRKCQDHSPAVAFHPALHSQYSLTLNRRRTSLPVSAHVRQGLRENTADPVCLPHPGVSAGHHEPPHRIQVTRCPLVPIDARPAQARSLPAKSGVHGVQVGQASTGEQGGPALDERYSRTGPPSGQVEGLAREARYATKRTRTLPSSDLTRGALHGRSTWRETRRSSRLLGNTKLESAQSNGASVR